MRSMSEKTILDSIYFLNPSFQYSIIPIFQVGENP
jgi:hypothetical protein